MRIVRCGNMQQGKHGNCHPSTHAALAAAAACRMRTGTSQAVPFVAGVLSLILENRTDVAPATVASLLESNAAQASVPHLDMPVGWWRATFFKSGSPDLFSQDLMADAAPASYLAALYNFKKDI